MTLKTPLYMQPTGGDPTIEYSALDVRGLIDGLFSTEGIINGLRVTQRGAGANFSVDISAGMAVVTGDDVTNQGKYLIQSTAVENRVIPNPPVSGSRIHRIVARVKDKLHNGTYTTYEWIIEVLEDTGGGTPSTPFSAFTLALVTVAAGQASVLDSNINNLGLIARLLGALRPAQTTQTAALSGSGFTLNAYTDFSSVTWPALTFTAPQSGVVLVTVSANVQSNPGTDTSTALVSWRGSGGGITSGTATATAEPRSVASRSHGRTYGSKRVLVSGLTPGASVTLTPVYYVTSTSGDGSTQIVYGQLMVEPAN